LDATKKAILRAMKLFFLGLVLQGMMEAIILELNMNEGTLVEQVVDV
jgi:hypothetical protein